MPAANALVVASAVSFSGISAPFQSLMRIAAANSRRLAVILTLILFGSLVAQAQMPPNLENGFKHWGSYDGGSLDTVNTMNGNQMLHAPLLPNYPQRGGALTMQTSLYQTSKSWQIFCTNDLNGYPYCQWSMQRSGVELRQSEALTVLRNLHEYGSGTGSAFFQAYGYSLHDGSGAAHQMVGIGTARDPTGQLIEYESIDTSGYHMTMSNPDLYGIMNTATVRDRHGKQYLMTTWLGGTDTGPTLCPQLPGNHLPALGGLSGGMHIEPIIDDAPFGTQDCAQVAFADQITDSNGNRFTSGGASDTMGRSVLLVNGVVTTTDYTGCVSSHTITAALTQSYIAPDGSTRQLKLCYGSISILSAFNVSSAIELSGLSWQLVTVALADGTKWTLDYDNYGETTFIGLPMGGSITYTWTTIPLHSCGTQDGGVSRAVTSRTVNDNTGHSYTWNYTWGTAANGFMTNTVTDPLGNDTTHGFTALDGVGGCGFYETKTQTYQGTGGARQLLKQVDTTYTSLGFSTDSGVGWSLGNVVATSIKTTIYPGGKVSLIQKTYAPPISGQPISGNVATEKQYDWGQGAPGPLVKETDTTYQWQVNSAYLTAHLIDLPAAVIIKDGNGNRVAETDYSYDESAYLVTYPYPLPAGTGTPLPAGTLVSPPAGVRGNLTTVSRWVNTDGSFVQNHTKWYDTGEVYQAIDPMGHTTTHSYDSAYAGAYSTTTCNAKSQCVSGTYDFNTGVLTSLTNANATTPAGGNTPGDAAHTSHYVYDFQWRLTSAKAPPDPDPANGGMQAVTTLTYSAANTYPLTIKEEKPVTTTLTDTVTAYFDGLARAYQSQHATPDGTVYVDTTFDGMGHAASVSNPYFTTSDDTYGITQTVYDALGRPTQVTKQDGAASTVDYSIANCTLSTDEAGKQRRGCSDAMGRLVEVDEPGGPDPGLQATTTVTVSGIFNTATVPPGAPRLAAAGSALASLTMSDGSTHTFYFDSNHHLCQLYWTSSSGWVTQDLTAATNWTVAASSSSIAGVVLSDGSVRIAWLSISQHVNLMSWSGGSWSNEDVTAETGNAVVAGGGGVAVTGAAWGSVMHMFYIGTNQHVYHMGWNGSWVNEDLTAATGNTLSGATSAVAAMVMNDGSLHVNYLGTDNHVYHLSCCFPTLSASGWVNQDLSTMAGSAVAAANTSLVLHGVSYGSPFHIYYMAANQHVYHAWWNISGWGNQDLTAATGNTLAAANTKLTVNLSDADGIIRLHYLGANQHVYELYCCGPNWGNADLMVMSGATVMAVSGSALSSHGGVVGSPVSVFYQGPDQHIYRMLWNSGAVAWQDTDPLPAASNVIVDAGTVSLTIPNSGTNFTATACYGTSTNAFCAGKPVNSSPGSIAAALAAALNGTGSPVGAVAAGSSINLTWITPAANTANVASMVSTPDNPAKFPAGSFSSSSATFSGGLDPSTQSLRNPFVTLYQYDTLGNLLCVHQKALDATADKPCQDASVPPSWRERWSTYNSVGQLLKAWNPESGEIDYQYDPDGNLWKKSSPAPNQLGSARQIITWCYDSLHRVTGRAYSAQTCSNGQLPAGTAVVSYVYDTAANGIGHVASMTDQAGTATYSYDILERLLSETRTLPDVSGSTTPGISKTVSYDYNLDGSLKALHYPSGAVVAYTPDSAGRIVSAVDSDNAVNYVTGATYGPDGAMKGFVSGNSAAFGGITNSFNYNKRLQPVNMLAIASAMGTQPAQTVFSIGYDFHLGNTNPGIGDNGNVYGITNNKDLTRSQTFTYDALNRLISAQNAGTDCTQPILGGNKKFWGNTYGYDAWGNLLSKVVAKCSSEPLSVSVGANNRISSAGFVYDAAGNMTNDGLGHSYAYDPENRISGAAGYTYTYDGDGNRVEKAITSASTGTLYWYMTPGVVAESDLAGTLKSEYVFFGGERVARRDLPAPASVFYYFADHLKTASVITDAAGNIKAESDYYPWGGELQFVNNDSNHYKFTGKERDVESGLDYFGARYYSNILGRFISADWSATPIPVPYADFSDPQSLNQYGYVRNLPTTRVDADGHDCDTCHTVLNFLAGAANAYGSDGLMGAGRIEQTTTAGKVGAVVGDVMAAIGGIQEVSFGAAGEGGGTLLAATGVGAPAGLATDAASALLVLHGGGTALTGMYHLAKSASEKGDGKPGEVYVTEPQKSGKPYVGRTTQGTDKRMASRTDGRTGRAKKVDTYKSTPEGRVKEQQQIDKRGLPNLDNKRNEIRKPKSE